MKTATFILALSTVLSAVMASPHSLADSGLLVGREQCRHPGGCGWLNSGQCEEHCDGYGGFEYMQGCGWGRKRCCCAEASG